MYSSFGMCKSGSLGRGKIKGYGGCGGCQGGCGTAVR